MNQKNQITENLTILARTPMERFRCETFWTKEPETLEWIKGFDSEGVFIDVGANIGIYSLFAASMHRRMKIYAVEPLRPNYQSIKDNIQLNGFDQIIPLNIAVSDVEGEVPFHILSDDPGSSGSQIERPVAESGDSFTPIGKEMIHCTTVDRLCDRFNVDCDYFKIDIDGREWQVLQGAEKALQTSIKSVLVELNPRQVSLNAVHHWMREKGFELDETLQSLPNHSNRRRDPKGPLNFIYSR